MSDKTGMYFDMHPDTCTPFINFRVPYFDEAIALCKKAAKIRPDMRYVGWDVGITPTGPVLVEGNNLPAYDGQIYHQQENPGKRVFVLDSLSTGPEQRLLAEHLRDLLAEGREFDEVCEEMLRYHKHTHLLFSLESLANLARNGRVKPAVAAVARMLGIRVIGQASEAGELDVLCKTRGEHGALERIVLELKEHGYTNGRLHISHCGNPAAAERLKHMVKAVFDGAKVDISECGGLCSYYAELGGLLVGYEDAEA